MHGRVVKIRDGVMADEVERELTLLSVMIMKASDSQRKWCVCICVCERGRICEQEKNTLKGTGPQGF